MKLQPKLQQSTNEERILGMLARVSPPEAMEARLLARLQAEQRLTPSFHYPLSGRASGISAAIVILMCFAVQTHKSTSRPSHSAQRSYLKQRGMPGRVTETTTLPKTDLVSRSDRLQNLHAVLGHTTRRCEEFTTPVLQHAWSTTAVPENSTAYPASGEPIQVDGRSSPDLMPPQVPEWTTPGETLPQLRGVGTPGTPLPGFPLVAVGRPLPTFAQSITDGDH